MLEIVENTTAISHAQDQLNQALRKALPSRGECRIGFPGGNTSHEVFSAGEGKLYYAYAPPRTDSGVPRHWNSFGFFRTGGGMQAIVAEINVPTEGDDARVAGFFATDPATGDTYLMHDGGLGGGRKGIGKEAFLSFISDPLVLAQGSRRSRTALVVANLRDGGLASLISRFVHKANAFKESTTSQIPPEPSDEAGGYTPEFSGRKSGTRPGEFDYFTYHGMIVDALFDDRAAVFGEDRVTRTVLIDLLVADGARRTEVYEVKTAADRTSFYTGLGQLITHAPDPGTSRTLVLPAGTDLPDDCSNALARANVGLRRFKITGTGLEAKVRLLSS